MDAFIGEIRSFPYGYVPNGWLSCDGTLFSIQLYPALYAVIGAAYGGNAQTTFAVPNLMQRVAMGAGSGPGLSPRTVGEQDGVANVTLIASQLAPHTHKVSAKYATPATAKANLQSTPVANSSWLAKAAAFGVKVDAELAYAPSTATPDTLLEPGALSFTGGNQAHSNVQPYLGLWFCICYDGTFPTYP